MLKYGTMNNNKVGNRGNGRRGYEMKEVISVEGVPVEVTKIRAVGMAVFSDGTTDYIWEDDPCSQRALGDEIIGKGETRHIERNEVKFVIPISGEIYRIEIAAGDNFEEDITPSGEVYIQDGRGIDSKSSIYNTVEEFVRDLLKNKYNKK